TIGDREVRRDFGPSADTHAVGLVERLSAVQRLRMRLAIGPHALLECPRQLGAVGFAHQVGALMIKRRVQKEPFVVQLEMVFWLTDASLAEREELLALGECPHSDGPFFESNRHRGKGGDGWVVRVLRAQPLRCNGSVRTQGILCEIPGIAKPTCKIAYFIPPQSGLNLRLCISPSGGP